jgi:hypothetical protein
MTNLPWMSALAIYRRPTLSYAAKISVVGLLFVCPSLPILFESLPYPRKRSVAVPGSLLHGSGQRQTQVTRI